MKQIPLSIFLMLGALGLAAQPEFEAIDALARGFDKKDYPSPEALATALCKNLTTERDKARALFTWIAEHTRYEKVPDPEARTQKEYNEKCIKQAYRNGKGVCMHYALLYQKMAQTVGLDCAYITGSCKKDLRKISSSHAWNAVKINGIWTLLDVTWGAGSTTGNVFNQQFSPGFCFVPPATFVLDHLPDDAQWQLLDNPVSLAQFKKQATFYYGNPTSDIQGFDLQQGANGQITLTLRIKNPPAVIQLQRLKRDIPARITRENGLTVLRFDGKNLPEVEVWGGYETKKGRQIITTISPMGLFPLR